MLGLSYVRACSWTQTNDLRPKTWVDIHGFGVIFRIVTAVQCMNLKVAMQISTVTVVQFNHLSHSHLICGQVFLTPVNSTLLRLEGHVSADARNERREYPHSFIASSPSRSHAALCPSEVSFQYTVCYIHQ